MFTEFYNFCLKKAVFALVAVAAASAAQEAEKKDLDSSATGFYGGLGYGGYGGISLLFAKFPNLVTIIITVRLICIFQVWEDMDTAWDMELDTVSAMVVTMDIVIF